MRPCLISAKEPAVYSLSSVQNDMPEQPTASQKPGLRPSDEPSARSISSSRADEVSIDERAAARRNDERAGDRSRSRTDRATAVSARTFGIQSPHEVFKQTSASQKSHVMPFLIFLH